MRIPIIKETLYKAEKPGEIFFSLGRLALEFFRCASQLVFETPYKNVIGLNVGNSIGNKNASPQRPKWYFMVQIFKNSKIFFVFLKSTTSSHYATSVRNFYMQGTHPKEILAFIYTRKNKRENESDYDSQSDKDKTIA